MHHKNNIVAKIEACRKTASITLGYEEWVEREETHVVAMCSQQITTGGFNRTDLDVTSPTAACYAEEQLWEMLKLCWLRNASARSCSVCASGRLHWHSGELRVVTFAALAELRLVVFIQQRKQK